MTTRSPTGEYAQLGPLKLDFVGIWQPDLVEMYQAAKHHLQIWIDRHPERRIERYDTSVVQAVVGGQSGYTIVIAISYRTVLRPVPRC